MGAWIEIYNHKKHNAVLFVAPLVGAWIEIIFGLYIRDIISSLLSWERGLKYHMTATDMHN